MIASAKYTKAASLFIFLLMALDFFKYPSRKLPRNAIDEKTNRALKINKNPRIKICIVTPPFIGFINCGRKTKKKSATFGLVKFMTIPVI